MKKFLSLVMALVMTMSLVTIGAGAKDFTDDSKINYKEAIDVMSAIKIIDGNADGSFRPANTLTRGAASKIICNLILGPTTASALGADTAPYKDVPANSMYSGYVAYCSQQGIINGYADGTFRPAGTVTGYQFMKMLLVALGYDGKLEGFTGPNWSVNVAKLAISIGLNKGNDAFNGSVAMTREEACLYAFNTLKTTMVEYDSTTNIVIGGTQVSVGGSKAKNVVNNASTEKIDNDNLMQFAEKYFTKLALSYTSDDFYTPSNQWKLDGKEIGLYSRAANLTYTTKVKLGDIYADLGLSNDVSALYYVDGDVAASVLPVGVPAVSTVVPASRGVNRNSSTKIGGNGALTSVYYTSDPESIVITEVNSYLGKISGVTAAEKNNKRFVTVAGVGAAAVAAQGDIETEEFAKKDYVVFNSAAKMATDSSLEWCVESLEAAKTVTGVFTSYTGADSEVIGGTTYKNSAKVDTNGASYGTLKDEVTAYLDSYGYVLDIVTSEAAESSYAYVVSGGSNRGSFWTKLLFTDGKTKIVDTKEDYCGGGDYSTGFCGDWVTFRVNSDGQYVLTDATAGENTAKSFKTTTGLAEMTVAGTKYANDSTVFVVEKPAGVYTVYTGYKNVPTIDNGATPGAALSLTVDVVYSGSTDIAKFVFVNAVGATISGSTKNVIYVVGDKSAKRSVDSDSDYYTLEAVVNGEIATLKVDYTTFTGASTIKGLVGNPATSLVFSGLTTDKYGVVTLGSQVAVGPTTMGTGTGISDVSKGTVTLNTAGASVTRAVDKDTKVFYVNKDGKIFASDIDSVSEDANDVVTYTLKDGAVNNIFIQQK